MQQKLQGMKNGDMMMQMKGGMEGMKEGMEGMMKEKLNGMMQMSGDKSNMMDQMGGKEGMMMQMGMMGGKDRQGNDMKQMAQTKMDQKSGMQSGPMDSSKMMEMRKTPEGTQGYNNGCNAGLCCGQILSYGVWSDEYLCYDEHATTVDTGHVFNCMEGATRLATGAAALVIAAMMM
jgi:hypothetical protein